jgi:hypothetical protein
MSLLERSVQRTETPYEAKSLRGYLTAGQLSAVLAAGIHAAVVPEHLQESLLIGGFFVVVALGQFALTAALRRRPPVLVVVGAIWAHVGLIALYVASRIVDLPFLPAHHGASSIEHLPVAGGHGNGVPAYPGSRIEPVGALDLICLGAELVLIGALLGLLPARLRGRTTSALMVLGVLAVLARAAGLTG